MRIQRYCQSVSKSPRLGTRVKVFLFLTSFLYGLVQGPGIVTGTHLLCLQDKPMCDMMPQEPPWEPDGKRSLRKSFPESSVGKESTCNAGDLSLIPGSRRSSREGIGYRIQYSWASLVAEVVKNPPAMWETWVQSLGWEDPREKGKATHCSILAWRMPWTVQSMGSQIVGHD